MPRTVIWVASVMTKKGRLVLATKMPLKRPIKAATNRVKMMASQTGQPRPPAVPAAAWGDSKSLTTRQPAAAQVEPTDRSTPPISSDMVRPMAMMPLIETWRRMLTMLPSVAKFGSTRKMMKQSAKRASMVP